MRQMHALGRQMLFALMFRLIVPAAISIALLVACDNQPTPYRDKQVLASVQVLRDLLGKPEGLKIMKPDQYPSGAICYTYRARNGLGDSLMTSLCTMGRSRVPG